MGSTPDDKGFDGTGFRLGQGHHCGDAFRHGTDRTQIELGEFKLAEGHLGFSLAFEQHAVLLLQSFRILHRLAVNVKLAIHDAHCFARKRNTSLDVVLHLVHGPRAQSGFAHRLFAGPVEVFVRVQGKRLDIASGASDAFPAQQRVVVVSDEVGVDVHGVSMRKAEHHGVVAFHISETGQPQVGKENQLV